MSKDILARVAKELMDLWAFSEKHNCPDVAHAGQDGERGGGFGSQEQAS